MLLAVLALAGPATVPHLEAGAAQEPAAEGAAVVAPRSLEVGSRVGDEEGQARRLRRNLRLVSLVSFVGSWYSCGCCGRWLSYRVRRHLRLVSSHLRLVGSPFLS